MFRVFKTKKKPRPAKILIVDDEPDYVSTVQCRLEWSQYKVVTAANGREGLEKAQAERPDLILLDTSMSVMDGHEMLERMRRDMGLREIPVIMVTALCEPRDVTTASSFGVVDYIAKPFDFPELLEKIAVALESKGAVRNT